MHFPAHTICNSMHFVWDLALRMLHTCKHITAFRLQSNAKRTRNEWNTCTHSAVNPNRKSCPFHFPIFYVSQKHLSLDWHQYEPVRMKIWTQKYLNTRKPGNHRSSARLPGVGCHCRHCQECHNLEYPARVIIHLLQPIVARRWYWVPFARDPENAFKLTRLATWRLMYDPRNWHRKINKVNFRYIFRSRLSLGLFSILFFSTSNCEDRRYALQPEQSGKSKHVCLWYSFLRMSSMQQSKE